ncbi:asparagine synthase (glutamine-hydrolyzing) [Flavobacterium sp.]|uniref:asparagine synthase (glutamine-hydrolyzing) n=3 Tax=Flavobacterium sp. TaxID=239 RepID=UPI004047CA43
MCGFTGYYYFDNRQENDNKAIIAMLALQKHRGPDDSGILAINTIHNSFQELNFDSFCDFTNEPNLIFGFNRLSILDLSPAGHQPMFNNESQVALMMNGEVYNAFDFKSELVEKGYVFKGNSDTEIVLNLYIEYGIDGMLQRLNGMFALAIYDGRIKKLFLVRDRLGIKPLYILQEENRISFSSEMKSFKALPGFKFELDETKLSEFLLFRNVINQTLFKNICNITPGTYWCIQSKKPPEVHVYYDVKSEGKGKKESSLLDVENALKSSVKRQMISDVKLGCQLSGGVDSSLVAAFASETLPKGALETVSIVFDEKHFSEKKYIDQVVSKLNLYSHQFKLDAKSYLDLIDESIWHFEQPLNHPNTIGIKLLSKEAKKYVTVLLSGEGADESLAGYERFFEQNTKLFTFQSLKRIVKNSAILFQFLSVWLNKDKRYILQTAFGGMSSAKKLYNPFSAEQAIKQRIRIWNTINDNIPRKKRKYELLTYLPDLLMRQDKMSMAHTIENRVPFLDNEMLEVALNCTDEDLIQKHNERLEGKWILKRICSDIFGEDFAFRDKMGFGIPLKSFFSSEEFQERWSNELLPSIKKRSIFNHKPLTQWMEFPNKMTSDQLDAVWLMMGFEIWAKQYLDD